MKKTFVLLLLCFTHCLIPFSSWYKAQASWFIGNTITKYLSMPTQNLKNQFLYDNNVVQAIQSIQDKKIKVIDNAQDLSTEQKTILKSNIKKFDITYLRLFLAFRINEDTLVSIFDCLPLTDEQLKKYFPLGLWINYKKKFEFKEFARITEETCSERLRKNWIKFCPIVGIYDLLPIANQTKILPLRFTDTQCKMARFMVNHNEFMNQVEILEKDFAKQGYITFVHGRAWEWNFANQICHMIATIKNLKHHQDPNAVILRLRKDDVDISRLKTYRQSLIESGYRKGVYSGIDCEGLAAELTFMNRLLLKMHGENSMGHFLENHSAADSGKALEYAKKMIKEHNLEKYVNDEKVTELYKQHQQCSEMGEIVYIAVRKEHVDNMVYRAFEWGTKSTSGPILDLVQKEQQEIFNPEVADYYEYCGFYCLAVSNMPNEEKICITRSLHAADSTKFAQFEQNFAEFQKQVQAQYEADK